MSQSRDMKSASEHVEAGLSLLEGDRTAVTVFMSDGCRLHDQTVDRVVQAAATQEAIRQATERVNNQLSSALDAITRWAAGTPTVKKIAGVVGYGVKIRVLFITEGQHYSEVASDALESLSSEVFELTKDTPFRFRYYLVPEASEQAARETFMSDVPGPTKPA